MAEDTNRVQEEQQEQQEDKTFTQQEVDQIIAERLQRERKKYEKFQDYDEIKKSLEEYKSKFEDSQSSINDLNEKLKDKSQKLDEADKQVNSFKLKDLKLTVALDNGLPYEIADRLKGETEEELSKDAQNFKGLFNVKTQPLQNVNDYVEETSQEKLFGNLIK